MMQFICIHFTIYNLEVKVETVICFDVLIDDLSKNANKSALTFKNIYHRFKYSTIIFAFNQIY